VPIDHKMIVRDSIEGLGYLNVERTKTKFLNNKFNKSKSITTKIEDVTYQKLIGKCESSNENKCQYLKRIITEKLLDESNKITKVTDKNSKSSEPTVLTRLIDGSWKGSNGVTVTEIQKIE